jgi:hypothetical protein
MKYDDAFLRIKHTEDTTLSNNLNRLHDDQ